eukprot:scaffold26804_cov264-Cylindrotheca_fusiformis.AAC.1
MLQDSEWKMAVHGIRKGQEQDQRGIESFVAVAEPQLNTMFKATKNILMSSRWMWLKGVVFEECWSRWDQCYSSPMYAAIASSSATNKATGMTKTSNLL